MTKQVVVGEDKAIGTIMYRGAPCEVVIKGNSVTAIKERVKMWRSSFKVTLKNLEIILFNKKESFRFGKDWVEFVRDNSGKVSFLISVSSYERI